MKVVWRKSEGHPWWHALLAGVAATWLAFASTALAADSPIQKKIPVIYDTDVGDDIDDTWALVLLLKCPELDVKLVTGDMGKSQYRAKLLAKLLEVAGRTDVPIGIGPEHPKRSGGGAQSAWVEDYDLKQYPGKVHEDGVQAIVDTIMKSPEPITVIAVGPMPNIRQALQREPRIAERARLVGMHGSVRVGYNGSDQISAEYNVVADIPACQAGFSAPWEITITPLDTCGLVRLTGEKFAAIRDCQDPLIEAVLENYRIWWAHHPKLSQQREMTVPDVRSSVLFDTVAVYLAFSQDLCKMETLPIVVDDKGFTRIDGQGNKMNVATEWNDLAKFEDFLVERLAGSEDLSSAAQE